jgi:hypothetical protein
MSIKITGIARFGLLEKLDHSLDQNPGSLMKRYEKAVEALSPEEKAEMVESSRKGGRHLQSWAAVECGCVH